MEEVGTGRDSALEPGLHLSVEVGLGGGPHFVSGWVGYLQSHTWLRLLESFGLFFYTFPLTWPVAGCKCLVRGKEDGGRCGTDGPMARPQQRRRNGCSLEERG